MSPGPTARDPARALRILVDLTRALTEWDLALEPALGLVTAAAVSLFDCAHASIRVLDDSGEQLLSGARSGERRYAAPPAFARGLGVAGWVVERGTLARVDDAAADARFVAIPEQRSVIGSLICVPLFAAGRVIGVLTATADRPAHFSEDDEPLAWLLANCAVPPLERARLRRLASTDALTGTLRQAELEPTLDEAVRDARERGLPLALVALDLDHFKRVNDTYGHAIGDEVLRVFARRVRGQVRAEDVVIRRGGEEFVVVLPACELDDARIAAERIRASLASAPIRLDDGRTIDQRVSAGVALWDRRESSSELEGRADAALYAAKRGGRDRVELA